MKRLLAATLHRIPAIPIEIQRRGLDQKQEAIDNKRREENIGQIVHQLGIKRDQQEQQDAAEQRRCGIGRGQELGEFLGQLVVAFFAASSRPTISQTQAKIGTPSTKPASNKCSCAMIQMRLRLPMSGNVAILDRSWRRGICRQDQRGKAEETRCHHEPARACPMITDRSGEASEAIHPGVVIALTSCFSPYYGFHCRQAEPALLSPALSLLLSFLAFCLSSFLFQFCFRLLFYQRLTRAASLRNRSFRLYSASRPA